MPPAVRAERHVATQGWKPALPGEDNQQAPGGPRSQEEMGKDKKRRRGDATPARGWLSRVMGLGSMHASFFSPVAIDIPFFTG